MKKYKKIYKTVIGCMADCAINNYISDNENNGWTLDIVHSKFILGADAGRDLGTNPGRYSSVLIFYKKELIK